MEYLHKRYEDGTLAQGNAINKKTGQKRGKWEYKNETINNYWKKLKGMESS